MSVRTSYRLMLYMLSLLNLTARAPVFLGSISISLESVDDGFRPSRKFPTLDAWRQLLARDEPLECARGYLQASADFVLAENNQSFSIHVGLADVKS